MRIRIATRSGPLCAATVLALTLGCSTSTSLPPPDAGSPGQEEVGSSAQEVGSSASDGGDFDAKPCTQPLDAAQPFGGCPAQFADQSWKDTFCPIGVGTVSEQTCTGYLLRQFDLGTHGWLCFYDPSTQALVAGRFADDVPSFCNFQSSTEVFGSIPAQGTCAGPLAALVNPCAKTAVCADPSASLPPPPCAQGWYQYDDTSCGPPVAPGQSSQCTPHGDGLCHLTCNVDADCTDPCFPKCGTINVFDGSDVGRPKSVCTKM